ncbi:MAG: hypothetical protein L0H84_12610 [Pseudonocardia sp.]|nr:hypothetical protein [Pseudonocardia sp.]
MNSGYASFADAARVGRRGPSALAHTVVVLGAWALAAVVTMAVARESTIGPVVLAVTRNHGLHAGDVAAFVVMSIFAMIVTIAAGISYWAASRRARRRY